MLGGKSVPVQRIRLGDESLVHKIRLDQPWSFNHCYSSSCFEMADARYYLSLLSPEPTKLDLISYAQTANAKDTIDFSESTTVTTFLMR